MSDTLNEVIAAWELEYPNRPFRVWLELKTDRVYLTDATTREPNAERLIIEYEDGYGWIILCGIPPA